MLGESAQAAAVAHAAAEGQRAAGGGGLGGLGGHRLDGIDRQVEEDLPELLGIAAGVRQVGGQIEHDLGRPVGADRLVDQRAQEGDDLAQHFVDVELLHVAAERPRIVEKLRHHAVQALGLIDDDLEEIAGVLGYRAVGEGGDELGRAFDRAQRIADLVGQAGGHLTQGGQAVALFHPLVKLGVLQGDAKLRRDADQHIELGAGKRVADPLVFQTHDAQQGLTGGQEFGPLDAGHGAAGAGMAAGALRLAGLAGEDADDRAGVQLDDGAGNRVQGLDFRGGVALGGEEVVLALELIEGNRLPGGQQPRQQRPPRRGIQALDRAHPEAADQLVAVAVGLEEINRGMGEPPGLFEHRQHQAHRLTRLDDVGQGLAQLGEVLGELEALAGGEAVHLAFEKAAQRLVQDQKDERDHRHHLALLDADDGEQHVDGRQQQHERRQHHDLAQQLVDIQQPVDQQRLLEEVQVDHGKHGAKRRAAAPKRLWQQIPGGKRDAQGADAQKVQQAPLVEARHRAAVDLPQRRQRPVHAEQRQPLEQGRDAQRPQVIADRRTCTLRTPRGHRIRIDQRDLAAEQEQKGSARDAAGLLTRLGTLAQKSAQKSQQAHRDDHQHPERDVVEAHAVAKDRQQVPQKDVRAEEEERLVRRAAATAQDHRPAQHRSQRGQDRRDRRQ